MAMQLYAVKMCTTSQYSNAIRYLRNREHRYNVILFRRLQVGSLPEDEHRCHFQRCVLTQRRFD